MSIAALIRQMVEAGAPPEAIAIAVEAIEARDNAEIERKAKRAAQKRMERERRATVARQNGDNAATVCDNPSPKESSPTPPKEITPSSSQDKSCSITPRAALETVLDAERAGAVIDHRKRLGKPLTAYAAKKLAAKLAQWPDPNFAADEMISNGWQGFKPEWLESRSSTPRQSTDPPHRMDRVNAILDEMQGKSHVPQHPGPSIDGSIERTDRSSAPNLVQLHAVSSWGRS